MNFARTKLGFCRILDVRLFDRTSAKTILHDPKNQLSRTELELVISPVLLAI